MRWADVFTAGVVAGITTTLTLILKEHLFPRSLEEWKERRHLAATYRRYRDPIVLSARELASRLVEIWTEFPTGYLDRDLWDVEDPFDLVNDTDNIHFQKYKLVSTVYRLCALFGWIELYRREVVFLNAGHDRKNKRLEACLHDVQSDLADGSWNGRDDWDEWSDRLIFREEQRAIGEAMIHGNGAERSIIGYGGFCAAIWGGDAAFASAIRPALMFVTDTADERDFRKLRFRELALHLIALIAELHDPRLPEHLQRWREETLNWRDADRRWLDREDLAAEDFANA